MSDSPPRAKRFPLSLHQLGTAPKGSAGPAGAGKASAAPAVAPASAREPLKPQGHWQQAAALKARTLPPSGLGLDSAGVRQRMVQRLRREGLSDERVLNALATVPRHEFVDTALAIQAYEDTSLPIGHGQTISKPSVVGRMMALMLAAPGAQARGDLGKVLEIGTGCGYQAALLMQVARHVVSVERLKPLHDKASGHLVGYNRVRLVYGDGMLGHGPSAPYDSIISAAGGDDIPQAWLDQLAPGGRLVAPMTAPSGRGQVLVLIDHLRDAQGSRFVRSLHEPVLFVPLKSGVM
ncbi:protein-L-isoaspartate(D-aspartate) O-methyltransferase [Roseateles terrae]|uniref:Protein-L-isoaspartate O-methyltransferase n=1 Tax=Roseateles terrae TaxID=431060 RepID=A0ABR6GL16_9BURK|nr:protein-L-isoaspartate(D-aspartate) O-methyltransferase [Roseateles terrae]MBB3192786.1 protein-L-isoaspartate(D-aspartate) O-methyltransferase [Roseateles terrae]OWQ89943.1 protein-L-isoaspartate O-methyltransferase [Roseateles terrae]